MASNLFESAFSIKASDYLLDNMDSENRSTADQSATTNSGSEQHLVPQDIDHLEGNMDSPNPASADQPLTTDSNTERVVFTLFTITPNSKAKVKETLTNFRRTVLIFWVRLEKDQLPGMYVGVLDGSNGSPDEMVLVEVVQDRNNIGRELSEAETVAEEERREIQETYHEQYSEVLGTLIRNGWLEVGRSADLDSEEGTELKEKLMGRRLGLYGVHL